MMGVLFMLITTPGYTFNFNLGTGTCSGNLNNNNPSSGQTFCADIDDEIRSQVEENLPGNGDISLGKYGTGVSNANAFSQRGLGSDYADKFDIAAVQVGLNTAIEGDLDQVQDDPVSASGFGLGAALTVGVNMDLIPVDKIGPVEMDKLDLFVSFMSYNPSQDLDGTELEGSLSSFGVMARYHLIEGNDFIPGNMLKWGGVFIHTGIQRSQFSIDASRPISENEIPVSLPNGDETNVLTGNSSVDLSLSSTSLTIPVEVSTYIRTAWAFTFYGGAGFDFVSAQTDVDFKINNTSLSIDDTSQGTYSNSIEANSSGDGEADATNFRAFVGFQINAPFVRLINIQLNKGLGNDLIGANFGFKVLY